VRLRRADEDAKTERQALGESKVSLTDAGPGMDEVLAEISRRNDRRLFYGLYPDDGPFARHKYQKHLEFFRAGATYRERCFMAANRTGKTVGGGGFETTCHCTGEYPAWWEGRRWNRSVKAWAAGKTNETTRDIIQRKLLGNITGKGTNKKSVDGTGLIPGVFLGRPTWKQGIADFIDTIPILHKPTGRWSTLGFKSYQQGSGSFEGTEQDVIWLDEEPPSEIYDECLIRTAGIDSMEDSGGMIMLTFTPIYGLSKVVLSYMPKDLQPGATDGVRTSNVS
jgi:phage terminase large subunit-like protein